MTGHTAPSHEQDGGGEYGPYPTPDELVEASLYQVLGPGYFRARRVAASVMADMEPEGFKPIIQKAADEFMDLVWDKVRDHIICDTEQNVMGQIQSMVDGTVEALISGKEWAIRQYPLAKNYDGQKLRLAIVEHCGGALRDKEERDAEYEARVLAASYRWWHGDGPALRVDKSRSLAHAE